MVDEDAPTNLYVPVTASAPTRRRSLPRPRLASSIARLLLEDIKQIPREGAPAIRKANPEPQEEGGA
jgi:hypothetical protein